jgi:hypothetical protein
MVASFEKEKGAEKFEIYATIHDQDLYKGFRKKVLTSQRKNTRWMIFHDALANSRGSRP